MLVHTLGNKAILRTKEAYDGPVKCPEVEDLLRNTLIYGAKADLGGDVAVPATAPPARPFLDIFEDKISDFSKYRLAKAFLRWAHDRDAKELTEDERRQWKKLIGSINTALK